MHIGTPPKRAFHKFIVPIEGLMAKATRRFDSDKGYRKFSLASMS